MRAYIASALQEHGWSVLASEEVDANLYSEPDFIAISSNSDKKVQIYLKKPYRSGKLGAGSIGYIKKQAAELSEWECVVVSNRGFTNTALKEEKSWGDDPNLPNLTLLSSLECVEYLRKHTSNLEKSDELGEKSTYNSNIVVVGQITPEHLQYLANRRKELEDAIQNSGPRFIEELVAENWKAEGYEVELVTRLNAGGPDVIATKKDSIIPLKVLTSCKWSGAKNDVTKGDVTELIAWVDSIYPANVGLLATNSRLQSGAIELVQKFHRINAINGDDLLSWTQEVWSKIR